MRSRGIVGLAMLMACAGDDAAPPAESSAWVSAARDANYDIAIDSGRISRTFDHLVETYEVWYRTDHRQPRLHKEKEFNREIVHSLVRCDSLWFKVVSVDMSMRGGKVIALQRMTRDEVEGQAWRRVQLGTSEEIAARAACFYAQQKKRRATRRP